MAAPSSKQSKLAQRLGACYSKASLAEYLEISKRSVDRKIQDGTLPRPDLRLGDNSPRWRERTIADWLEKASL